ncbi:hypothetical protein [uncultured Methylobacterium sp.]|uniref:hypothetical protein n=1 Tax=uncultured Methylobacterium sp. TaxID=157278 RepID=UPI002593B963|nr:hypothetical protein [uncultured Methylobacterium sp.]
MAAEIDYGVDCAGGEPQRLTVAPLSFGVTLAALLVQGDGIAVTLRGVEETFVVLG